MEEHPTDPKEKRKIQNRVAQRAHREKLKSRILQLETQLESVGCIPIQSVTSKNLSFHDNRVSPFAVPGVLPASNSHTVSEPLNTGSVNISLADDHDSTSYPACETTIASHSNKIHHNSTAAEPVSLPWSPMDVHSMDLEWVLADAGASTTVLERPQFHLSSLEGSQNTDCGQTLSSASVLHPPGSSDPIGIGRVRCQSAHKTATSATAQETQPTLRPRSDGTRLERLGLLLESARRLGFSDLNEALSLYYTSDLSESAIMSHEQSLDRVRKLPSFLSRIREHSSSWPSWERNNYVREILRSAEHIYAEECKGARMNLWDQDIASSTQRHCQFNDMSQITRVLQQENPHTWALLANIILHSNMPGESQQPQTVLVVMILLCYRRQDINATLSLCQKRLH